MDLINCRSLTILSCSNSLNCLHINPWLPHFITASQPLTTFELSYLYCFSVCLQYKCAQACRCGLNQRLSQTHSDTLMKAFSPGCKWRDGFESPGKRGESCFPFSFSRWKCGWQSLHPTVKRPACWLVSNHDVYLNQGCAIKFSKLPHEKPELCWRTE